MYTVIKANSDNNPTDMHLVVSDESLLEFANSTGPLVPVGQFEQLEDANRFRRTMNQRARQEQNNG